MRVRLVWVGTAGALLVAALLPAPSPARPAVAEAGHHHASPPLRIAELFDQQPGRGPRHVAAPVVHHRAGGRPAPGPKLSATAHYSGYDSWEPTLGVTRDGDLFFPTAIDVCCATSQVVRSLDRGKTWDAVNPKLPGGENAHFVSFDPYVYVDLDTDRLFTVDLTMACSTVSFSDDDGDSWTSNPLGCGMPVNDHPTLFAGPPATSDIQAYPNVVYYCYNNQVALAAFCSRSLDGGQTFIGGGLHAYGGRVDLSATDSGVPFVCGATTGHGAVGPDGTVYLPRVECGQPWLAMSRDEGATWETVQIAGNGGLGHEAGIAVDEKGTLYYTWTSDADHLPYLAISRDRGRTWSDPVMVGAPGIDRGVLPGIAVGEPGHVAIVYMGTEEAGDAPRWSGYVATSDNALSKDPKFATAVVGDTDDPLTKAECLHRCLDAGDFFDVVIGADDTVWAAFVDACYTTGCIEADDQVNDANEQGIVVELRP